MNKWDKDNLHFLLTVSSEVFDDWLNQADADDIQYALELLREAKSELILEKIESFDNISDVSDAKDILKKIKEK